MAAARPTTGASRPRVVIAGLGDTGVLVATHLGRRYDTVGITTRPALMSGQEVGMRLGNPQQWRVNYLLPFSRFRRLDRVRTVHGRITGIDLDASTVQVEAVDGARSSEPYDALVLAVGVTNGFWRHARVQDLAAIETELHAVADEIAAASTIAVVGGGATGVSAAANLATAFPAKEIHLFHSQDLPLPGYHPRARKRIVRELERAGVHRHPHHRARVPEGLDTDRLTTAPIDWETGQDAFVADRVLWALGKVCPNTDGLPASLLDDQGFVRVDANLRVPGTRNVFAVGDVAATDPHRSSARNWGFLLVTRNVKAFLAGRTGRMRSFSAPEHRWGSILGPQADGMLVFQPNGKSFRVPPRLVQPLLMTFYLHTLMYGGLRKLRGR